MRARLPQIVPTDHFAADETACNVGVDRGGRLERVLPLPQGPRTRLLVPRGEEADQTELGAQAPHYFLERRSTFPENRGLIVGQLRELRLELEIDTARPVLDSQQRLRRQRLELFGQTARILPERAICVDVRQNALELCHLLPELLVA